MIRQCFILFGCLALGELIVYLTGIKLPSSIIGMLLLTLFLQLGWIKLEWVQGLTNFLVANLGFFFVPSGVALMLYFDVITAQFWPIVIATLVSTILVLVVTGWVHQLVRKYGFFEINFSAGHYVWLFLFVKIVAEKTGWVLLNPILVAIAMLICFLQFSGVSYETYSEAGSLVEFWLKPAVVALGVPLYLQLRMIKKQLMPILISQLAGCVVGLVSVTIIAKLMGASPEVIMSLAPKSVTTPIAMEVSNAVGGIPSLTAAVVIVVGLFGAICGFKLLQVGRVASPIAQGLSMGTASHAVGTSRAMEVSGKYGAYASLGLTLNGILTALLSPTILHILGLY